jgi:hypothetical protein
MFELAKQQVKLIKASTPMENHGKDFKLACVLTIEAAVTNKHLSMFSPDLCNSLYRMAEKDDTADLVTPTDSPTVLRFPKMSPFTYDWEGSGYELVVDYGLGGASDMKFADAKVDSFTISPMEGGTVAIRFNVIVHPEALDTGRLCEKQKQNIDITLTAPPPANVGELFKNGEQGKPAKLTKAEKEAKKAENLAEAQKALEQTTGAGALDPAAAWPQKAA